MPYYKSIDELPEFVRAKLDRKDQKKYAGIANETFRKTGKHFAASSAANKAFGLDSESVQAPPIINFASSVFPEWDAAGVYKVQILATGTWPNHPLYGDIVLENDDLAEAVRNFRGTPLKVFLDYNHAITDRSAAPGDKDAIGWMADMWIEDLEGNVIEPDAAERSQEKVLLLFGKYEVNAEANEKIKDKKYAFYSPTWYPSGAYFNEETGEYQTCTVVGGAATNRPYINGMKGFVAMAANETQAGTFTYTLTNATGTSITPPIGNFPIWISSGIQWTPPVTQEKEQEQEQEQDAQEKETEKPQEKPSGTTEVDEPAGGSANVAEAVLGHAEVHG